MILTFTRTKDKLIVIIEPSIDIQFFEFLIYLNMYYSKPVPLIVVLFKVIVGKFLTFAGHGLPCSSVTGDVQGDKKLSPITDQIDAKRHL